LLQSGKEKVRLVFILGSGTRIFFWVGKI